MERAEWLNAGLDSAQARHLMITAITHHQINSPIWGENEVRKLYAELAEIERSAMAEEISRDDTATSHPGPPAHLSELLRRP